MGDIVIYTKFELNNEVNKKQITIGDIAHIYCEDKNVENKVKGIELVNISSEKRGRYIFSLVEVCKRICEACPGAQVSNIGESDFVIDYINDEKKWYEGTVAKYVKIVLICLITLCGSAFTIIAYDNDVDIPGVFEHFYTFLQGGEKGRRIMELAYSLGFGGGIIVFFNHFGSKKITSDPTPMEVEMTAYEKDIDDALITRNSANELKKRLRGGKK